VTYQLSTDSAHAFANDVPPALIKHLYSNIPDSGINADDEITCDTRWRSNGYFRAFDQKPLITKALTQFIYQGGDAGVPHRIADTGYFYYPKKCVVNDTKCKFMVVNHPAGGFKAPFADTFGQCASSNDIVMIWPAVKDSWDDSGYTGDKYNTKNSIQSLFIQEVVKQAAKGVDPNFDY